MLLPSRYIAVTQRTAKPAYTRLVANDFRKKFTSTNGVLVMAISLKVILLVCLSLCASSLTCSEARLANAEETGVDTFASMPIREVTIFKDGHAFVFHSGSVTPDRDGNVLMDQLPTPVIGTFWPYVNDPNASLKSVTAGKQIVSADKTALSIRDLLTANVGARVEVREGERDYRAVIVSVPTATSEELESTNPDQPAPILPQPGQLILLQTDVGTRAIPIDRIQDVTFIDPPKSQLPVEQVRALLKLKLDWKEQQETKSVKAGLAYLQKGLRWIPQYKLTINADGSVRVKLQATLLNELADLNSVTANLVIGVPSFEFKATIDPIALRETVAQLSPYFQESSQTSQAFSNSIMVQTQVARTGEYRRTAPRTEDPVNPDLAHTGQNEETFIFSIGNVTLAKGERMVVPVGEWTISYKDVFRLEVPSTPPMEIRRSFNSTQEAELAKLFHAPKVKHVIRLTNSSPVPLTTAPALITSDKGILGQSLMTYTSSGGTVDLPVTTAINVAASNREEETSRTPEALAWRDHSYMKIDVEGIVQVTNFRNKPIDLEVTRTVLGIVDGVDAEGKARRLGAWTTTTDTSPEWWSWYSWPYWWSHVNSTSQIEWKRNLKPGESIELPYRWHYFWTY